MKGTSFLEIGTLLFLFFLTVAVQCQEESNYNGTCGPDRHCRINKGLICTEGLCKCGSGSATEELKYLMTWDATTEECAAMENGVCIGTRKNPVAGEMKSIKCVGSLTCVQVGALPLGQGVCRNIPQINDHGNDCDQNTYCDSTVGLICREGKCACGDGPLNHQYSFDMEWDNERGLCLGKTGGACVGTPINPVAENMKNVECITGECVQIQGLPPGVGVCTSDDSTTNPTPTTTTPESNGTTSTRDPNDNSGASVSASVFALTATIIFTRLV